MFQNGLEQKTSNFWAFFSSTRLWEPSPQQQVQVFLTDSEACEQSRDFGNCSHIFHANVVITGKPSYSVR